MITTSLGSAPASRQHVSGLKSNTQPRMVKQVHTNDRGHVVDHAFSDVHPRPRRVVKVTLHPPVKHTIAVYTMQHVNVTLTL